MNTIDTLWLLICCFLVMLMQAGFLFLECGMCRQKNYINVAIKNFTDFSLSFLLFALFGYPLMKHGVWSFAENVFSFGKGNSAYSQLIFQSLFCGTAATIISGSIAERMSFRSYLLVCAVVAFPLYPLFAHFAWHGELKAMGYVDFAGASVVHVFGGLVALIAAIMVGPRLGRFQGDYKDRPVSGSNLSLSAFGTLLLILGWLGFNGGSLATFNTDVPRVILNTLMAAVGGCCLSLLYDVVLRDYFDIHSTLGATVAGMVVVTASAHLISPGTALALGAGGGVVYHMGACALCRLKIDDVVGAIPAHLLAGMFGILVVPFVNSYEIGALAVFEQLRVQAYGLLVLVLGIGPLAWLALEIINRFVPMRITMQQEELGLNIVEHRASDLEYELLSTIDRQSQSGDINDRVRVEPFTQVGRIASHYNTVLDKLEKDQFELLNRTDKLSSLGLNTAEIAHDLRDPVQVIQNCLFILKRDFMKDGESQHRGKELLQIIGKEGQRITKLIDLLQTSLATDELETNIEVREILQAVQRLHEHKFKKLGIKVSMVTPMEPLSVRGRVSELTRMLSNLISNAVDAIADLEDRWIKVHVGEMENMVEISVTDSGKGLPDQAKENLFRLFYTTKEPGKGTGLGLNIVRKIVEKNGGTIALNTESPHTQFCVILPKSSAVPAKKSA